MSAPKVPQEDSLAHTAHEALAYGAAHLPDKFGGAWIDPARQRVHVLLTDNGAGQQRTFAAHLSHSNLVVFDPAAYTQSQLIELRERIVGDTPELRTLGIEVIAVGNKVDANKVQVTVSSSLSVQDVESILSGRYPADAFLLRQGVRPQAFSAAGLWAS